MLDLHYIVENPQKVKDAIVNKGVRGITPVDVDTAISLAKEVKDQTTVVQKLRSERNKIAESTGIEKDNTKKQALIGQGKELKEKLQKLEEDLHRKETELTKILEHIPNVPSDDTPIGPDATGNVTVRTGGEKPAFDFEPKDHVELLTSLGLVDFERGSKVSGFRGYFLKGDLVLLQWGLLTYTLQKLVAKGYTPVVPPVLVKKFTLFGSGHMPWSTNDIYETGKPDIDATGTEATENDLLAGTAEIPLMGMFANETVDIKNGPVKMVGISPCYRREVGSYSKDVKGFFRVHEFTKIEQVILCEPDDIFAEKLHQEIMQNSEEILKELGLHYRVLAMCTGDMGEPQYKKFDIETWMPGKNDYGETHSASNMRDFQCRRNNIKVVTKSGEKAFAYSLNNTAIASPRFLVALVENYQTKDGKIMVPEVLQPFVGKEVIG